MDNYQHVLGFFAEQVAVQPATRQRVTPTDDSERVQWTDSYARSSFGLPVAVNCVAPTRPGDYLSPINVWM